MTLPVLVCLAGLLVYALAANPKAVELGRLSYVAGLLVAVWRAAEHFVSLP